MLLRQSVRRLHTTRLLPPMLEQQLRASTPSAVETTLPVPHDGGGVRLLKVVVCNAGGALNAFENYCPHAGGGLFMNDGMLQCRLHGARFKPADGVCTSGPCEGDKLVKLPIEADGEVGTSLEALIQLRNDGSGGKAPNKRWQPNATMQQLLDAFAAAGLGSRSAATT